MHVVVLQMFLSQVVRLRMCVSFVLVLVTWWSLVFQMFELQSLVPNVPSEPLSEEKLNSSKKEREGVAADPMELLQVSVKCLYDLLPRVSENVPH